MRNRPAVRNFPQPKHIKDYPTGPCFDAGYLVTTNAGWRTEKPLIDENKCIGCFLCYLYCPEGVIFKKDKTVDIDYDFCKGCGICASECPKQAITMIPEGGNNGK